jgi:hypothetical protein
LNNGLFFFSDAKRKAWHNKVRRFATGGARFAMLRGRRGIFSVMGTSPFFDTREAERVVAADEYTIPLALHPRVVKADPALIFGGCLTGTVLILGAVLLLLLAPPGRAVRVGAAIRTGGACRASRRTGALGTPLGRRRRWWWL